MIQKYAYLALAVLAIAGSSFGAGKFLGYRNGVANEKAKVEIARLATQKLVFALDSTIDSQALEIEALIVERKDLVRQSERNATMAIGAGNPGIGANGGLLRLEQRWNSP